MGFQAEQAQGVGGFQTEQAAADHHAGAGPLAGVLNGGQILQGAVNEAALPLPAGNGGHKGHRAGSQHQAVVGQYGAGGGSQGAGGAVDGGDRLVQAQCDAVVAIPLGAGHQQLIGRLAAEDLGQVHPVVGGVLFGAEHCDVVPVRAVLLHQLLQQMVSYHAVTNDDQFLFHHCYP